MRNPREIVFFFGFFFAIVLGRSSSERSRKGDDSIGSVEADGEGIWGSAAEPTWRK
jgi:hypothetical protein